MRATVHPATGPLFGVIEPPSSKNYTTRFILVSALADGVSIVSKPAVQDDAVAMVACCRELGAEITALDPRGREVPFAIANAAEIDRLEIRGTAGRPRAGVTLDPQNAGTVLRLLMGAAALAEGEVRFVTSHTESLGKRPNIDLLRALRQLGVECECVGDDGRLPIVIRGGTERIQRHLARRRLDEGIPADEPVPVTVSGAVSSQFLSSLLFLIPLLNESIRVAVTEDLKSRPLIETTRWVLGEAGVSVESSSDRLIHLIRRGQGLRARRWEVNGDWPGTAAILGAAAVVPGSEIRLRRLREDEQGERKCLEFYRNAGCTITREVEPGIGEVLRFASPMSGLRGATIDGDQCTDAVLAMMGAAACAAGESVFHGIRNLQFKECDRVREPIAELRRIAGSASVGRWEPDEQPDTIRVAGDPADFQGGIEVDGHGDHRVIMLLSIVALRTRKGLTILGAEHVAKSFPGWFDTLRSMGARVELD